MCRYCMTLPNRVHGLALSGNEVAECAGEQLGKR